VGRGVLFSKKLESPPHIDENNTYAGEIKYKVCFSASGSKNNWFAELKVEVERNEKMFV
jgi:hypothetical protein